MSELLRKEVERMVLSFTDTFSASMTMVACFKKAIYAWVEAFEAAEALPEGPDREAAFAGLQVARPALLSVLEDMRQIIASANPTVTMDVLRQAALEEKERLTR